MTRERYEEYEQGVRLYTSRPTLSGFLLIFPYMKTIDFLKARLIFEEEKGDVRDKKWTRVSYKAWTKAIPEEKDYKIVMLCA